uniref:Uncharacterized protein n=1 Tax=Arundo donax TaxID=35708 RepID=A0A0A8YYI2_ARUDO
MERKTLMPRRWHDLMSAPTPVQPLVAGLQWPARFSTGVWPLPNVGRKATLTNL